MSILHSGGFWLRRIIALGATVVALGAVLVATPSASAAPDPAINVLQKCGGNKPSFHVEGTNMPPSTNSLYVEVWRANGAFISSTRVTSDSQGKFVALLNPVDLGNGPVARVSVYYSHDESDIAEAWYFVGCAGLQVSPFTFVRQPNPEPWHVSIYGFRPSEEAGPVRVTGLPGVPDPVDLTVDKQGSLSRDVALTAEPACGRSTVTASQETKDNEEPPSGPDIELKSFSTGPSSTVGSAPKALAMAPMALAPALPTPPRREVQTTVNVLCPTFAADPTTFANATMPSPTTVSGRDWVRLVPVQFSVDNGNPFGTATPDRKDGAFRTEVTVPRLNCGPHQLKAVQIIRRGEEGDERPPLVVTMETTVTVLCPRLAANPNTLPDTALPRNVGVTGGDWSPLAPVQFTLDGQPVPGTVTPNQDGGTFRTDLKLPRRDCGPHTLEAVQVVAQNPDGIEGPPRTLELRAQATITVTCGMASLAVNPAVTPESTTTTAAGAGFVPGRAVRLEWLDVGGRPMGEACTTSVSSGGTFLVTCLVMPNSGLGPRRLRAVEVPAAGDPVGARTGVADLLVVPGSMIPGRVRFLERR